MQRLPRRFERAHDDRALLGGEARTEEDGAVLFLPQVDGAPGVAPSILAGLDLAVDASPAADDALDVGGYRLGRR